MPTTKRTRRPSAKRTTRKSPAKRSAKRTAKPRSSAKKFPSTRKNTSPYASAFNSAIKRGTACSVAVNNIAQRTKKSPKQVFESLFKAGHVNRQKFNGQWVYWAAQQPKVNKTNAKQCQIDCWQQFIDWCFANGFCTPEQMNNPSSQNEFMAFCRKFWNRQFNGATSSKKVARKSSSKKRKSTSAKAKKRTSASKSKKRSTTRAKKRSTTAKSKKRSTTVKNKKRTAPKAKRRSTTTRASKPRTTVRRKSTKRTTQPASFKFPTASRRIRKAA